MSPVGPEAPVRCVATIRPKSGVKPTCQNSSTDAFDPLRKSAWHICCDAQSLPIGIWFRGSSCRDEGTGSCHAVKVSLPAVAE